VLAGSHLMVVGDNGKLVNAAVADGKIGTEVNAGKGFYLPPIVANNMLYLIDGKGRISSWR